MKPRTASSESLSTTTEAMDGETVEAGKRKNEAIFKPNIPVIIYSTAIVVLAAGVLIPLWLKYDPLVEIMSQLKRLGEGKSHGDGATNEILLSKEELANYGAEVSKGKLYLGILGKVFDVTVGQQHYGKEGSYSFFTGSKQ